MNRFQRFMDYIALSLNEILDLLLHSILFSLIVAYLFGGLHDVGFALFFIVPGFILFAPLIKNLHQRHKIEWFVKVPLYLFAGLMLYLIGYGIFGSNITDDGRQAWQTAAIIVTLIEGYWVYRTLRKLSKPPLSWEERRQRSNKRSLVSFVLALGAGVVSVFGFSMVLNPTDTGGEWSSLGSAMQQAMGGLIGMVFFLVAMVMFVFFVGSVLDRT